MFVSNPIKKLGGEPSINITISNIGYHINNEKKFH